MVSNEFITSEPITIIPLFFWLALDSSIIELLLQVYCPVA